MDIFETYFYSDDYHPHLALSLYNVHSIYNTDIIKSNVQRFYTLVL